MQLAERCRHAIYNKEHGNVGRVTASLGIGELGANEALTDLIERVDQALYSAKNSGRNKTRVANRETDLHSAKN